MQIVAYRAVNEDNDDDECDENNNLLCEYTANSATTTINHYML